MRWLNLNEVVLIDKIRARLKDKRFKHTLSVQQEALKLSRQYHCNSENASLAAILHDMCRDDHIETLNTYVKKYNLDNIYLNNKPLSHSKVASLIAKEELNISHEEVINAVSFHTTGRANMSLLEKIIFLSDMIEKDRSYKGIDELRELAYKDLDSACLMALDQTIKYVIEKKEYLHIDTLLARNYLIKNKGGKDEHKSKCNQSC